LARRSGRRRREEGRASTAALAAALAVLACTDRTATVPVDAAAGPPARRTDAAAAAPLDCAFVRDEAIRACVNGFHAKAERIDERTLEFRFALHAACPYAGAVAWSGCHRGAFEKFAGRSAHGRCGDEADYIETAVLTSCMRPSELPVELWNSLVQRCFGWAAEGSTQYQARCDAGPGSGASR
jgi:hypothetical protein